MQTAVESRRRSRLSKNLLRSSLFAVLALFAVPQFAEAQQSSGAPPRVRIDTANPQPMPIAVMNLAGDARLGADITRIVSDDLERSGLFKPIDPKAFVQTSEQVGTAPRFADWRLINAQALVSGAVTLQGNQMRVEFRLWDVFGEAQMEGQVLAAGTDGLRRVAHKIADAIYKSLTAEDGYFDTQLVFVAESGPADNRRKQLAIMDQDGFGYRTLTDPQRVRALTPRFSPTARELTYMAYVNDVPRVYLYNIDTGQQEILGNFSGMTFAPRFTPDGQKVLMSFAENGNSEIYSMDLRTRRATRLTDSPAIDTSPSASPDGTKIVFNSDRGGVTALYVMNADGSGVQKISPGRGRYNTPVWSPRGDYIAFTKQEGGQFQIGVMRPDGTGEKILAQSYLDEGPTWAPNGRVLMFFRQQPTDAQGRGGSSRLVSVDITGRNLREVTTPTDASDPAWSPLIP
ncbi:translocation protein TolB [Elstera litoralis]|uniref:Tol-Pal system protein TolB n=1 Tax=Elstera litoralis TaxID=552518 RepID=A0A0F3IYD4_9PROT|nr:Tol-Pal system beta propeller repeat protein TolB [Elstera litoralis]KJV10604.1 translocation protein TolB [Elstera litoralis]